MDGLFPNGNCFLTTKCVLFAHLLGGVKEIIIPFFIHQLVMRAELFDLPILQEKNMVNETNGAESVGYNNACMLLNIRK